MTLSFVVFGDEVIEQSYIQSASQNSGISQNDSAQQNDWQDCDDDDDDCDDDDSDCSWRSYEFRDITLRFLRA